MVQELITHLSGCPVVRFKARSVMTDGDKDRKTLVRNLGGGAGGVFTTQLEQELLAGKVDIAVHSLKDLPTAPPDGLVLAVTPPRADPLDARTARRLLGPGRRLRDSVWRRADAQRPGDLPGRTAQGHRNGRRHQPGDGRNRTRGGPEGARRGRDPGPDPRAGQALAQREERPEDRRPSAGPRWTMGQRRVRTAQQLTDGHAERPERLPGGPGGADPRAAPRRTGCCRRRSWPPRPGRAPGCWR
jgi:hypothetical protein